MNRYLSIFSAIVLFTFTCCQNNTKGNAQTPAAQVSNTRSTNTSTDFIKPIGIYASISDDWVQIAEPRIMHLYTTDGRFEFMLTWAGADQTPQKMRAALSTGTTLANGMIHKSIGKSQMLNENVEMIPFGVYDISMTNPLFEGLEIHDWSTPRGVLVVNVMSRIEDKQQLEKLIQNLHASIKIPSSEELQKIKAQIDADRSAGIKSKTETKYWNKVVGHTLLNRQFTGASPMSKVEQRFELCESGKAKYNMINGAQFENLEGVWDIYETEDGVPLLVITDDKGEQNKWQIGPHISGNVTIGQAEFTLHASGTPDGPNWCSQD